MQTPELPELVKASAAAARLGITPRTLAKWSDSGVLPQPLRIGPGQRRHYRVSDISALLHEGAA